MLQDYASPAQMLNNGIALSLPSSPKARGRKTPPSVGQRQPSLPYQSPHREKHDDEIFLLSAPLAPAGRRAPVHVQRRALPTKLPSVGTAYVGGTHVCQRA